MDQRLSTLERRLLLAGVLVALAFAAITGQAWEDYWITYRSSKNLALGHGLVFQPGERLHCFTSPIGVLLPAFLSVLVGNQHDFLVLWIFRIISALLFLPMGLALVRAHRRLGVGAAASAFALLLLATEIKVVSFSVNGQESAFLVLFLAIAWWCHSQGADLPPVWLGAAWAGLQWTRPDGFIYGGAMAAGALAFLVGERDRVRTLLGMTRAALVALALYGPWLLWTWWYYGTPIPHTIYAKEALAPPHDPLSLASGLLSYPFEILAGASTVRLAFAPVYAQAGHWPALVMGPAVALGALAALYWLVPGASRPARAMSLAFALGHWYQSCVIVPYPWYLPATTFMGVITLALVVDDLARLAGFLSQQHLETAALRVRRLGRALAAGSAVFVILVLLASTYQIRIYQLEIEDRGRMQIGLWLKTQLKPGETVFLEPLGYISFFSGGKMLDFPGLASEEVVQARRRLGTTDWNALIPYLDPDWLVLRLGEAQRTFPDGSPLLQRYEVARSFDATPRLAQYPFIPGRLGFEYDKTFIVFHHKPR